MKSINLIATLAVNLICTFVNAQSIFRASSSEFFIETPPRARYTITLGDETISSRTGRFRFFDLPQGRLPVVIELNNRVIFRSDVFAKPGTRTIAALNRNALVPVKYLDLDRKRLDNWDRVLDDSHYQDRPGPGRHYHDDYISGMSPEAFDRFMRALRDARFDKEKMEIIDLSAGYSRFTVEQIKQVVNLMSFSDEKLEVLRRMYPSVADPENGAYILELFSFSDKEKARSIILSGKPASGRPYQNGYGAGMSPEAFERFMKSLKDATFYKDKLAVLDLTVGYADFTVSQIKQVLGMVNFTEEKLEVLKKMYPSASDPENGFQILDSFTFSSDKEKARSIIVSGRTSRRR